MSNNYNKYCNCQIPSNEKILELKIDHSFCKKCGSILLKDKINENIYYTIKPKHKQEKCEINPIEIIKAMKANTNKFFPYLNNDYNMNNIESNNLNYFYKSIDLYDKFRKMIIKTLQNLINIYDFGDLIFFQCLFYLDSFLSHMMTEKTTEKDILYYLVGYFLCSCKLRETDLFEPSLESLGILKKNIFLSAEKISEYEIICLKNIGYNPFGYSTYEWLNEIISNGIIFNCEIDANNKIILINGHRHSIENTINKYSFQILLNITLKNLFYKYSPMYIAFSIIQIARKKYLDKNLINNDLYFQLIDLYGINFKDYEKCYLDLKRELKEIKKEQQDTNIINNEKDKIFQLNSKTLSVDKCSNSNNLKQKLKSNINLINLKDINNPNKDIKTKISEKEKINKIIQFKENHYSDNDKLLKENSQKNINNLNINKINNTFNDNSVNKKTINIINNDHNQINNNMTLINQENKNKNVSNTIENDINCNKDKPNENIILKRRKVKSKSHIAISCKTNNCKNYIRNNIRHKSNNIRPLPIFNTNIKEVEENTIESNKNLFFETKFNNKFLTPIDNSHCTENNRFRISKNKENIQRKTKYIISENPNNNQLFDTNNFFNSKHKSKKDVFNFKLDDYFNLKFNNINENGKSKISLENEKYNNNSNNKIFKSSDKFIKNDLVAINNKMNKF